MAELHSALLKAKILVLNNSSFSFLSKMFGTKFSFKDIKEKRRIALAILSAAEEQGIPTRGAKKFSKNGRRVGWITLPYMRNISYVDKELIPKVIEDINYNFIKMLEELVAKNPNLKLIK